MPREPDLATLSSNLRRLGGFVDEAGQALQSGAEHVGPEWGPISPLMKALGGLASFQGGGMAEESGKEQAIGMLPFGKFLAAIPLLGRVSRNVNYDEYFDTFDDALPMIRVRQGSKELGSFVGNGHADAIHRAQAEIPDLLSNKAITIEDGYMRRGSRKFYTREQTAERATAEHRAWAVTRQGAPDPDAKPSWKKTIEEVTEAARLEKRRAGDIEASLFGKEGAKRYQKLHRQSDSIDAKRADAAFDEIEKMEAPLSKADRDSLYGIGESGPNVEELEEISRSMRDTRTAGSMASMGKGTPDQVLDDLADDLAPSLTQLPDPAKVRAGEALSHSETIALAKFQEATRILEQQGIDGKQLTERIAQRAASRFSDPEDAAFMLSRFRERK